MKIYIHPHTTNNFQVKWSCPRTELIILEGFKKLQDVQLVNSVEESNYVIWNHVPQNKGEKSFELINRINPEKLIIVDSIDENDQFFVENFRSDSYFLYFKRSILAVDEHGEKHKIELPERCLPWDYGILDGFLQPNQTKSVDIGCYIRSSCYNRALLIYLMKRYSTPNIHAGWNIITGEVSSGSRSIDKNVYFDPIYFDYLARTKIIVSCGPYAWTGDSRPSEAFANNCLFISDEAYRFMPNSPIDGQHWLKWNPQNPQSLYDLLDWSLSNPEKIDIIRKEGYEWARMYHSSEARAKYIVDTIRNYK